MPNRFIKESVCKSETLNLLTAEEERLFYRLIVNCDDFGRFDAKPAIVKNQCFRLDEGSLKIDVVEKWINRLCETGLIILYENQCKRYLQFITWGEHQQQRANNSKYPDPYDEDSILLAFDNIRNQLKPVPANIDRTRISNTNTNTNTNSKKKKGYGGKEKEYTEIFEQAYKIYPRPQAKADTFKNWSNLLEKYNEDQLLQFVQNYVNYCNSIPEADRTFFFSSNNFFGQKVYFLDFKEPRQWNKKKAKSSNPFLDKVKEMQNE